MHNTLATTEPTRILAATLIATPISRGVPIAKALERESLIAWSMNGEDLPLQNGYPLRLVCAGWPASVSGKWLNRIDIRDQVHDGEKMSPPSYSVPAAPIAPGYTCTK